MGLPEASSLKAYDNQLLTFLPTPHGHHTGSLTLATVATNLNHRNWQTANNVFSPHLKLILKYLPVQHYSIPTFLIAFEFYY